VSKYEATVSWHRRDHPFLDDTYSRGHEWSFDGGVVVPASASPEIVALPMSVAENVDPEEAFIASISSCHMLFFLSIACKNGIVIDSYDDNACGFLQKDDAGNLSMTKVVLRPQAKYSGDKVPERKEIETMHHLAHKLCFIANSVKTDISTEIVA